MLNKDIHKNILINTLNSIYKDTQIRTFLGFKGGTAALLFYKLPRFSVDLDFDLLDINKKELVFQRLKEILSKSGKIDQAWEKQNTLFFLVNYKKEERNIKVEISKRSLKSEYEVKNYLGIPMLVMKKDDMVASKLAALITRKKFATRDMFDLWFFLVNNWSIDEELLKEITGLSIAQALDKAQKRIKNIKKTELLAGLGDLLDNKQKAFVKEKLRDDLMLQLKIRQSLED
ncbi:MAG TPA: nucleotidyl transferase AbiEii/AbiGii toxin family protein [Patescibacteria group bacterium]|jgi:predicted nucleotidyltransferase component of viral defense system|nr:nucleotidyl transferase AbiEii/AbiGii toxin family protein [Patescibacteria group bacterium]